MSLQRVLAGLTLSCVMGLPVWAFAANPPVIAGTGQQGSNQPATTNTQSVYVAGFGQAVSTSTLGHYSGGSLNVQSGTQTITGTVTGDSATNVTTGTNVISGDSFSGASGLPSVIQNTGNNVLIQNGVIVNVQMKP